MELRNLSEFPFRLKYCRLYTITNYHEDINSTLPDSKRIIFFVYVIIINIKRGQEGLYETRQPTMASCHNCYGGTQCQTFDLLLYCQQILQVPLPCGFGKTYVIWIVHVNIPYGTVKLNPLKNITNCFISAFFVYSMFSYVIRLAKQTVAYSSEQH